MKDTTSFRSDHELYADLDERTKMLIEKNEELRRSEERYHHMIAEVQDYAIILMDQNGIIQNWNKGAEKIKGYRADEIVGKSFKLFYTPEDQVAKLPDRLIELARVEGRATHEGWRVKKDGTTFWGSIVITALHDNNNRVIGFSKVTRDLTERKLAEDALRNNARLLEERNKKLQSMNQELTSFAYVSSHDLQEPLRKIQTFASRILETEADMLSERGRDYFNRMQNAAHRMQVLIEDLLAYSRTNTREQKFETIDLNKLLDDVRSDLKERIEEKHAVIESDPLPTLNVVGFQFRQLFDNLLGNSLKFSKAGVPPRIHIGYEKVSGDVAAPDSAEEGPKTFHHFTFKDNGIGFEEEHKNRIFEVFQRLHGRSEYSGTGIGLAICKKIVENHQGIIRAEGVLNEGATFHVYIPENLSTPV
jgi:PAS domain S-box-containing protein